MSLYEVGKLGRKLGESEVGKLFSLEKYFTVENPFLQTGANDVDDFTSGVSSWRMCLNDSLEDCGVAGDVHLNMANGWTGKEYPVGDINGSEWPTDTQLGTGYFTYEGSPNPSNFTWSQENGYDQGVDLGQYLLFRTKTPLGPIPAIAGFAKVPNTGTLYRDALHTFGCLYSGDWLTNTDMNDFRNGNPWDDLNDRRQIGGHCTVDIYRDSKWGKKITWGKLQNFSWPWHRLHCEEVYVVFSPEQMNASGGVWNGINVAALRSDIQKESGTLTNSTAEKEVNKAHGN